MEAKNTTKIYFKIDDDTIHRVSIMRDGKEIGHIFSELKSGTKPYPHQENTYCLNSLQICGFNRHSEIWSCGIFGGTKDCVVHFFPTDDKWYQEQGERYVEYVKRHFSAKTKTLTSGAGEFTVNEVLVKDDKPLIKLKNFDEWLASGEFGEG